MKLFLPRKVEESIWPSSVSLSFLGLSTHGGRSSLAFSLQDLGNRSATCEGEKEGENNTRERDKFRTALQEAGRDQLKLFQVARRAGFGSKLKLLARARTKALSTRGLAPCLPLSCLV